MRKFDKWLFGKAINRAERRGRRQAEERIIKLWEQEMTCDCETPMPHLLERIKGNAA